MALQDCTLNLNRTGRELQPHGTPDFPCAGYSSVYTVPGMWFPGTGMRIWKLFMLSPDI